MGIFDIVPSRQRRANLPMATDPDRDPIHALQVDLDRAFGSFWNLMPFPSSNALLRDRRRTSGLRRRRRRRRCRGRLDIYPR